MPRIVNLQQGSPDWFDWRKQGITATDAVVLLDRSPYKTYWRLWAEKSGFCDEVDLSGNPLVRRGKELEDEARAAAELLLQDILLPCCVESEFDPIFRASLDGYTSDGNPVELKVPSDAVWNAIMHEGTQSEAYRMYWAQVQAQLLATGSKEGYLIFYHEGNLHPFKIHPDSQAIHTLVKRGRILMQQVRDYEEPPMNPERDVFIPREDAARNWLMAAEAYRNQTAKIESLKSEIAELEEKRRQHEQAMLGMMGDFLHAEYGGVSVTRFVKKGRVNSSKLIQDIQASGVKIDVDAYRAPSRIHTRITVSKTTIKPRTVADADVLQPIADLEESGESLYFD